MCYAPFTDFLPSVLGPPVLYLSFLGSPSPPINHPILVSGEAQTEAALSDEVDLFPLLVFAPLQTLLRPG